MRRKYGISDYIKVNKLIKSKHYKLFFSTTMIERIKFQDLWLSSDSWMANAWL